MSAKRATGRKAPKSAKRAKRSPRKARPTPKASTSRKSRKPARVPQGQEAARNRASKLSGGAAVLALLPDASKDAVERALAGEPEYLYALQVKGRPGHYLVDSNAHPNAKQITTTLSTALTWHNRTGPNTHMRRRPELAADFIPCRLEISAKPAANSIAANDRKGAAAKAIAEAAAGGAESGKDATAAA